eukprot:Selendium_serpulae@DN10237_c0_g1_i1.p1
MKELLCCVVTFPGGASQFLGKIEKRLKKRRSPFFGGTRLSIADGRRLSISSTKTEAANCVAFPNSHQLYQFVCRKRQVAHYLDNSSEVNRVSLAEPNRSRFTERKGLWKSVRGQRAAGDRRVSERRCAD